LRVGRPLESFSGPLEPPIRAQNDLRRAAAFGDLAACFAETGGRKVPPVWALYEARPLALSPPLGFLPSFLVHAAVFGTIFSFFYWQRVCLRVHSLAPCSRFYLFSYLFAHSPPNKDLVLPLLFLWFLF